MDSQFKSREGDPVTPERWQWLAILRDGSRLLQFDYATDTYHYFGEIDHSKVQQFGLIDPLTNRECLIDIPEGAKLIHFYDNIIQQPLGGTAIHHRLFCFGYETKKDKSIYTVLPNDFIVKADPENLGVL